MPVRSDKYSGFHAAYNAAGGMSMVMSWIWTGIVGISILFAIINGSGGTLASAIMQGAQAGVTLGVSMAGSICLWSGAAAVMEAAGITGMLSAFLKPLMNRVFPSTRTDTILSQKLSANICANFLGLGNAATPLGLKAAGRMARGCGGVASDELCLLVVLNTASIQLIPATVASLRAAAGCETPFDILPAVWVTSLCSAGMGLLMAWLLGRLTKHD